jgi:hypothetical protein
VSSRSLLTSLPALYLYDPPCFNYLGEGLLARRFGRILREPGSRVLRDDPGLYAARHLARPAQHILQVGHTCCCVGICVCIAGACMRSISGMLCTGAHVALSCEASQVVYMCVCVCSVYVCALYVQVCFWLALSHD